MVLSWANPLEVVAVTGIQLQLPVLSIFISFKVVSVEVVYMVSLFYTLNRVPHIILSLAQAFNTQKKMKYK